MIKNIILFTGALVIGAIGCGGGSSKGVINTCATPSSTYAQTFTTLTGTCGDISPNTVDVGPKGRITVQGIAIKCGDETVDGCSSTYTDCTFTATTSNSTTESVYNESFTVDFSADGSSATGTLTLSGQAPNTCSGTYTFALVRN
jgi:hypothetical protein